MTPETFEALVRILEDPKTTDQARASYLTSIYEALSMMHAPPRQWLIRFIQAMLKLLTLPQADVLKANIESVCLPNILGLKESSPKYSAEEVFKDRANERQTILSALKSGPQSEFTPGLIHWLERKDT
jgi:hypothetical protein